jgi:hypothetical protein
MYFFEYIINIYNSVINVLEEVQLENNDILNKYGEFFGL